MASRAYRRNSRGQFAGAGGGTKVTYGKAGGFANKAFASRVAASRGQRPKAQGGTKRPGVGATGKSRRAGAFVRDAAFGKKGTRERRRNYAALTTLAVGSVALNQGVKRGNDKLLVGGLGAVVVARGVYATSHLGKSAKKPAGRKIKR